MIITIGSSHIIQTFTYRNDIGINLYGFMVNINRFIIPNCAIFIKAPITRAQIIVGEFSQIKHTCLYLRTFVRSRELAREGLVYGVSQFQGIDPKRTHYIRRSNLEIKYIGTIRQHLTPKVILRIVYHKLVTD